MTTFHLPNMSCGHCKAAVKNAVHALDPEAKVTFDMAARQVSVETAADMTKVQAAIAQAGYPATVL